MTPDGPPARSWRRWLVLGAIQLLLVVLLAEVAVRVAATRHRGLRMVLNASTDTRDFSDVESLQELMERTMLGFSPNSVQYGFRLNSRSFRTREYAPGAAPDRIRVAAMGDSFTFASGALPHEVHWTTLAEQRLDGRLGLPVEVLRFGVPDTGPAFQLRLWQLEVSQLQPDVVVFGFFVGNDFIDHRRVGGLLGSDHRGLGGRLASSSAFYRVTRNLIRVKGAGTAHEQRGDPDGAGAQPGEPVPGYLEAFDPGQPTFGRKEFVAIEAQRMALCLRSQETVFDELAGRAISEVRELAAEIEATGARLIVMVIPDQYQVDGLLVEKILETTGNELEDYDLGDRNACWCPPSRAPGSKSWICCRSFAAPHGAIVRCTAHETPTGTDAATGSPPPYSVGASNGLCPRNRALSSPMVWKADGRRPGRMSRGNDRTRPGRNPTDKRAPGHPPTRGNLTDSRYH